MGEKGDNRKAGAGLVGDERRGGDIERVSREEETRLSDSLQTAARAR